MKRGLPAAPLSLKLVLPFLLLVAAAGAMIHVFWLPTMEARQKEAIVKDEQGYLELLAITLTPALLTGDLAQVHETLVRVRAQKTEWKSLRLVGADERTLFPLTPLPDPPGLHWLSQKVGQPGSPIATLSIGLPMDALLEARVGQFRRIEFLFLAMLAIVSLLAIGLQEIWVRQPLKRLSDAASRIAQGDYSVALSEGANDEMGQFAKAFQQMRDTLRERESALLEGRARLQAIIDNAVEAIITIDPSGVVTTFSRTAERIFGYAATEVLGRNVSMLMSEPHRSAHDGYLHAYRGPSRAGVMGRIRELTAVRKNGEEFPMLLAVDSVALGEETLFVGAILDISDLKKAEQAAAQARLQAETANRQLHTAIDALEDGFALFDADDRLVISNTRYREIFSRAADLLVPGIRFEDILREGVAHGQYPAAVGREEQWIGERMRIHQDANSVFEEQLNDGRWLRVGERRTSDGGIVGFRVDVTALKQVQDKLRMSLDEKEVLLREIHHRVKNNLLVAGSLLELQQEQMADPHLAKILQESRDRIHSMALIHEKLSHAEAADRISLDEYLETLVARLMDVHQSSRRQIQMHMDFAPVTISVDAATPCGLILNELISNALEHAFPDGRRGDVWLTTRMRDEEIEIGVCDNGVGLAEETAPGGAKTLGLQLVTLLTRQLEGTLSIDRAGGTAFRLRFKEPKYRKRI